MTKTYKHFHRIAWAATLLCLCVIVFGSFVRLSTAGLSCPDWPTCYGRATWPTHDHEVVVANAVFERAVETHKAWREQFHRHIAGILGLLVLTLALLEAKRRERAIWAPIACSALVAISIPLYMHQHYYPAFALVSAGLLGLFGYAWWASRGQRLDGNAQHFGHGGNAIAANQFCTNLHHFTVWPQCRRRQFDDLASIGQPQWPRRGPLTRPGNSPDLAGHVRPDRQSAARHGVCKAQQISRRRVSSIARQSLTKFGNWRRNAAIAMTRHDVDQRAGNAAGGLGFIGQAVSQTFGQ